MKSCLILKRQSIFKQNFENTKNTFSSMPAKNRLDIFENDDTSAREIIHKYFLLRMTKIEMTTNLKTSVRCVLNKIGSNLLLIIFSQCENSLDYI